MTPEDARHYCGMALYAVRHPDQPHTLPFRVAAEHGLIAQAWERLTDTWTAIALARGFCAPPAFGGATSLDCFKLLDIVHPSHSTRGTSRCVPCMIALREHLRPMEIGARLTLTHPLWLKPYRGPVPSPHLGRYP